MSKIIFLKIKYTISIIFWIIISFFLAQFIIILVEQLLKYLGININLDGIITNIVLSTALYVLTLIIVLYIPKIFFSKSTSSEQLGVHKFLSWNDILIIPGSFIIYFIFSSVLIYILINIFPWIDIDQKQDIGISNVSNNIQLFFVFLLLVIIAPLAEELLFRGFLLGKLMKNIPIWLAVIITSLLFAVAHGQINVAIDTFALSVILCMLRIFTKKIWSGIFIHMIKNGVAFYLLFINTTLIM